MRANTSDDSWQMLPHIDVQERHMDLEGSRVRPLFGAKLTVVSGSAARLGSVPLTLWVVAQRLRSLDLDAAQLARR